MGRLPPAAFTAGYCSFQLLGGNYYHTTTVPVQVVGYQFRPRWAVQVGAAYSGYRQAYSALRRAGGRH